MQSIILISILIALATTPINMLVDFLFYIISAPLADEYKVDVQSREARERLGRRVSQVAADASEAIGHSVSVARNALNRASVMARNQAPGRGLQRTLSSRVSSRVLDNFTIPHAETRKFSKTVVLSHASTALLLKGAFESQADYHQQRARALSKESSMYDSVERGQEVEDPSSFSSFSSRLVKQSKCLDGHEKIEFQERWGLDSSQEEVDGLPCFRDSSVRGVPSGVSASGRRNLCSRRRQEESRAGVLSRAMEETTALAQVKISKLRIAPDIQVGLEVMHLFIIDLLG